MHYQSALLWSGGKDCALVLHILAKKVDYLVTLVPTNFTDDSFQAHPIWQIKQQARRLNLPLLLIEVDQPYSNGYDVAFARLKTEFKVRTIYTGDIDFYDPYPNVIVNACQNNALQLIRPLWHKDRNELMDLLLHYQMQVVITWNNSPHLPSDIVGQTINQTIINQLLTLPIDLSGERGEYHTMLVASPLMSHQ